MSQCLNHSMNARMQRTSVSTRAFSRTSAVVPSVSVDRTEAAQVEIINVRRSLLAAGVAALFVPAVKVEAREMNVLCVDALTEEDEQACRLRELAGDATKQESYGSVSQRKFETAPNVPVSVLNDEYVQFTIKLGDEIEKYCSMDVYDKTRPAFIKSLKTDALSWVSKYARGGSARSQSARRMYIAADAVVGHLASNGFAPLPAPKVKSVLKSIGEARDFLAKGL